MSEIKKPAYFIDTDDEAMYLDMIPVILADREEAENIFTECKDETSGTHLSNNARKLNFNEMSYKNLRYLILGCVRAGAELRVKALAAFTHRVHSTERLNKLVSNKRLLEMMQKSLKKEMEQIYKWSNVPYEG